MENEQIRWEAPEYTHREKNREWYISFCIIALALFIAALLFKNILFSIVIALIVLAVGLNIKRLPETFLFEANRVGIIINKRFYPYSFLYSFWVDRTEPESPKLLVTSKKLLMPMIIIPLGEQNPDELRNFLANYLPEQELMEPLSHKILEYFGF
jgi:hypothetical protein